MHQIEAAIGALFAFVVGVACVGFASVGLFALGSKFGLAGQIPGGILAAVFIICEGCFLYKLKEELGFATERFAVKFAASFRRWPTIVRPFAIIWWLAHFALAILLSILFEKVIFEQTSDWTDRAKQCLVFAGLNFTAAYSVNLYVLLILATLGSSDKTIEGAWRWRYLVDAGIAVVALAIPFLWK